MFVSPASPHPGPMSTVGMRCAAVAPRAGNQWRRIFAPSNDVMVQSPATPATRVATTGPPFSGGTHFGAIVVVEGFADDEGDADFDADDEQAASTPTNRPVPIRPSLRRTVFPPSRMPG